MHQLDYGTAWQWNVSGGNTPCGQQFESFPARVAAKISDGWMILDGGDPMIPVLLYPFLDKLGKFRTVYWASFRLLHALLHELTGDKHDHGRRVWTERLPGQYSKHWKFKATAVMAFNSHKWDEITPATS